MVWKNNFSEINLALNTPITFTLYEEDNSLIPIFEFKMRIPTVEEVYTDTDLMTVAGLFNTDIDQLQGQFPMIQNLSTHFGLFNALLLFGEKNQILYKYISKLLIVFQKLGIPISLSDNKLSYILDDYILTYDIFHDIQKILMICMGLKKISDFAIDDPVYAEMQKKINRIKKNGNNVKEVNRSNLLESIITLTYEFNLKIDEVKQMNMFQMNTYLSYVGKSIQHKVSVIACGNGLSKKVKYITDKGK